MRQAGRDFQTDRGAFTVIELLVVIAVIGLLFALLLPAVQSAREAARRSTCHNHLKQYALALHSYHSVHQRLPAGSYTYGPSFAVASGWGWAAMVLPMIDQSPLYEQIDFDLPTAVDTNIDVINQTLATHVCPSDIAPEKVSVAHPFFAADPVEVAAGNYLGVEPLLAEFSSMKLTDVLDGTSQTLFLGEQIYEYSIDDDESATNSWVGTVTFADSITSDSLPHQAANEFTPINGRGAASRPFASRHLGGSSFAFADGHVKLLAETIDLSVYIGLGTADGGEPISF